MDVQKQYNLVELLSRSHMWAINPETLVSLVRSFINRYAFMSSWEASKPSVQGKGNNKVAIIPIEGVLTSDGPAWYGTNYQTIADSAERAAADPAIKRIVLSVDSPGGEAMGLPETAAVIAQAAKVKPVSAMVEGMAASAAYWLTSQAQDVTVTPSGEVGAVGIRMMHVDVSKMLDDAGYKVTELYSGNHKTEWSPFKPLAQETIDHENARLRTMHQDFINAVSAGRGNRASAEMKDSRFGEGRMLSANDALNGGLIDKIQASRDFYRAILPPVEQQSAPPPDFGLHRASVEIAKARKF